MHVVGIHQRRIEGVVDGVGNTFFTRRTTDIHDCHAAFFQRIAHVREIRVYIAWHGNNLRYRARSVCHHVVRFAERIQQVQFRINLFEFLVIDDQQRIDVFRPSKAKGIVTMPTVSIPISCATSATTAEAPVPVPPPIPAVIKSICVPSFKASRI